MIALLLLLLFLYLLPSGNNILGLVELPRFATSLYLLLAGSMQHSLLLGLFHSIITYLDFLRLEMSKAGNNSQLKPVAQAIASAL